MPHVACCNPPTLYTTPPIRLPAFSPCPYGSHCRGLHAVNTSAELPCGGRCMQQKSGSMGASGASPQARSTSNHGVIPSSSFVVIAWHSIICEIGVGVGGRGGGGGFWSVGDQSRKKEPQRNKTTLAALPLDRCKYRPPACPLGVATMSRLPSCLKKPPRNKHCATKHHMLGSPSTSCGRGLLECRQTWWAEV